MITGPQLKRPLEQALVDAPLSLLIRRSHVDTATVIARLKVRGIDAGSEESIGALAQKYGQDENRLLAMVFLPNESGE